MLSWGCTHLWRLTKRVCVRGLPFCPLRPCMVCDKCRAKNKAKGVITSSIVADKNADDGGAIGKAPVDRTTAKARREQRRVMQQSF